MNELAVFLITFSLSFGLGVVLVRASKVALTKYAQPATRVLMVVAMGITIFAVDQSTRIAMWGVAGLLAGLTTTHKRAAWALSIKKCSLSGKMVGEEETHETTELWASPGICAVGVGFSVWGCTG